MLTTVLVLLGILGRWLGTTLVLICMSHQSICTNSSIGTIFTHVGFCRVTDGIIQSTLQRAVKGDDVTMERIMLVIAHRVDTIYDCDQLLVLADGRLVQSGRPRDLAEGSGTFAQLVRAAHSNEHSDAVNPLLDASASSSLNRLYYKQAS